MHIFIEQPTHYGPSSGSIVQNSYAVLSLTLGNGRKWWCLEEKWWSMGWDSHTRMAHDYLFDGETWRIICRWCNCAYLTVKHLLVTCAELEAVRRGMMMPLVGEVAVEKALAEGRNTKVVLIGFNAARSDKWNISGMVGKEVITWLRGSLHSLELDSCRAYANIV